MLDLKGKTQEQEEIILEHNSSSTLNPKIPSSTLQNEDMSDAYTKLILSKVNESVGTYLDSYMESYIKPTIESQSKKNEKKRRTPTQMNSLTEFITKVGAFFFVCIVCIILATFGGIVLVNDPSQGKEVWATIGPIVSGAMTGMLTYFTLDKKNNKK